MPNISKLAQTTPSTQDPSSPTGAAAALVGAAAAVFLLITILPPPGDVFSSAPAVGIPAQIDRVSMVVATILTWALAAWLGGVLLVVIAAQMASGTRRGEQIITRSAQVLLPRALRGVVVTAVGVGSLTAMTGCAPGTATASTAATVSTGDDQVTTAGTTAAPTGRDIPLPMTLDWPMDPSTTAGLPAVPQPDAAHPDLAQTEVTAPPAATTAGPTPPAPPAESAAAAPGSTSIQTPVPAPVTSAPVTPAPATPAPATPVPTPVTAAPVASTPTEPDGVAPPAPSAPAPTTSLDPAATVPGEPVTAPEPAPPAPTSVTVTPGDSLWSIAAARLPAGASDADIAADWPRWYEANRALIGADPGQIEPGWQLTVPTDPQETRS